jgi:hypothetical protein
MAEEGAPRGANRENKALGCCLHRDPAAGECSRRTKAKACAKD